MKRIMCIKKYAGMFAMPALALGALLLTGCEDSKSYAEKLNDENKAVNLFLADNKVIDHIPADSLFEHGPDAPYYCIDSENSIYMQVINPGDSTRATKGQTVYFRYSELPLTTYKGPESLDTSNWGGNANDVVSSPAYFRYDDYTDFSSQTWGTGLQQPLHFLGLNCEVNLVVKSQYGPSQQITYVIPFLYNIRYFKSQL